MQPPQQLPPGINPDDFPNVKCNGCGSDIYLSAVVIKKVPITHPKNPHGKELTMVLPYQLCIKCLLLNTLTEWRNDLVAKERVKK